MFSDAVLHTAAFLSQNLPPTLDTIVPPTYVRQVIRRPVMPPLPSESRTWCSTMQPWSVFRPFGAFCASQSQIPLRSA